MGAIVIVIMANFYVILTKLAAESLTHSLTHSVSQSMCHLHYSQMLRTAPPLTIVGPLCVQKTEIIIIMRKCGRKLRKIHCNLVPLPLLWLLLLPRQEPNILFLFFIVAAVLLFAASNIVNSICSSRKIAPVPMSRCHCRLC